MRFCRTRFSIGAWVINVIILGRAGPGKNKISSKQPISAQVMPLATLRMDVSSCKIFQEIGLND